MEAQDSKKEVPYGKVPIGVFWDIENCQVPRGKSATALVGRIRDLFFQGHAEAEFLCVCDIRKELPEVVHELNLAQVTVVHINAVSKNAADDKLKQCMRRFVDIHGSPATLVLISGDVNFSTDLSDFRHRRQIRVVLLHGGSAPEALTACAHESHSFVKVASGLPPRSARRNEVHCLELMVTNLPAAKSPHKIKNRLMQLSENCGGRVSSISGATAVLKYPTMNAALRSRRRMEGENVCGNAISVSLHKPRRRQSRSDQTGATRSSSSSSRSPESSSVEADNYYWPSQHFKDRFSVVDVGSLEDRRPSLAGPEAAVGYRRPKNVGHVSPSLRSSSQPGVSSVCHYNGAQVADPVSAQPPSTSSRNRSCSPTKSANPLLFRNLPGICAGLSGGRLPFLGRVDAVSQQGHQNATVPGSSVPLEEQLQNVSLKEHSGTATCVRVTNFDPSLDMKVVKRMLVAVFQEKGLTVLNVTVNLQQDGNVEAFVYVPSAPEAVRAFHLIHQRRVGLYCLHLSVDEEVQAGMGVPPRCLLHDSTRPIATVAGTARPLARPLPEACVPRATWVAQLRRLLDAHDGILLLDSLKACYRAEFGALPIETNLEKWQAGTVPLEHLVASVPGVSVVSSKRGFKRAQREESSNKTESIVKGSPTERLALDMVELLSLQPHCRVEVGRLTTVYQAHFSRNFCVLNYGCAKVADVMATIPEVVEVLGHGYHGVITLTHAEQMKRFVWDMERLFKGLIAPKTLSMASLLQLYLTTFERPLDVADYGVCTLDDLLEALPRETFVVERKEGTVFITYPESAPPDPTLEVAERLRLFARELVQLLSPLGDKGLPVHKLGHAYQQEFGRPLRIANYLPYGKMTHLIEAISDVAEIHKSGRRKMVRLVPGYRHPSRQLPPVPKEKTSQTVEERGSVEGPDKRSEEACVLDLLFEPNDCMDMAELWGAFHQRWGSYPDLVLLRGLEHSGCVIVDRCTGQMKLSPLYHLAWQLRRLLYPVTEPGEEPKMSLVLLEEAYLRRYGKPPPLQQLGFKSLEELLNSLPKYFDMCWDRDARAVSLVEVNRAPAETVANDLSSVSTVRVPSAANYSTVDQATTSSLESCSEPELLELCRQAEPELMQLHPEPVPCHLPEPELLELFPPTDDSLLDEPIPSNVPSPVHLPRSPTGWRPHSV
nr:meiosis regulator and mRNA stability factor 1-like [Rhipicephalus microplus]